MNKSLKELCKKIGWEDWCVPYGGIENPYRIIKSSEEDGSIPCYVFMGEIFELSLQFNDLTKILNKLISNHNIIHYEIKFYMKKNKHFSCSLNVFVLALVDPKENLPFSHFPDEHVFLESSDNSFEDALYLSIKKLNKDDWFNSDCLK